MGNICFSAKHKRLQRKFSEGAILRPCKGHSENSEPVRAKRITLLGGPTFDSHLTCLAALIEAGADVNETLGPGPTGHTPLHYHLYNTSCLLTTKYVTYISSVLNYWLKKELM